MMSQMGCDKMTIVVG